MNKDLLKGMNKQINLELESAYLYLGLSMEMEKANYKGYAKWLRAHYKEELEHADDFIDFLQKRQAEVDLIDIKQQRVEVSDPMSVAKMVLAHEKKVSASIDELYTLAFEVKDRATSRFLATYVDEQIEEEEVSQDIVDKFAFAGDSVPTLYMVDKELGS